jgi:hypothetical protein
VSCFLLSNGAGPDGPGRFISVVGELQKGPKENEKLQHNTWQ